MAIAMPERVAIHSALTTASKTAPSGTARRGVTSARHVAITDGIARDWTMRRR